MDIELLNQVVTKEFELPYNRYKHNDVIDTLASIESQNRRKKRFNKKMYF